MNKLIIKIIEAEGHVCENCGSNHNIYKLIVKNNYESDIKKANGFFVKNVGCSFVRTLWKSRRIKMKSIINELKLYE